MAYKLELAVGGRRQEPNQQQYVKAALTSKSFFISVTPLLPLTHPACCTTGHAPSLSPLRTSKPNDHGLGEFPNRQGRLLSQTA